MLKKTIKYTDYEGEEREEDFWFNLTKAELIEMEVGLDGGLSKTIERVSKTKNKAEIIKIFKTLILKSYGEKSNDGKRFIKSDELSKAFSETEAYSNLFMELGSDYEAASAFVNGIIPKLDDLKPAKTPPALEVVNP